MRFDATAVKHQFESLSADEQYNLVEDAIFNSRSNWIIPSFGSFSIVEFLPDEPRYGRGQLVARHEGSGRFFAFVGSYDTSNGYFDFSEPDVVEVIPRAVWHVRWMKAENTI